jgi:hypothetical protein
MLRLEVAHFAAAVLAADAQSRLFAEHDVTPFEPGYLRDSQAGMSEQLEQQTPAPRNTAK